MECYVKSKAADINLELVERLTLLGLYVEFAVDLLQKCPVRLVVNCGIRLCHSGNKLNRLINPVLKCYLVVDAREQIQVGESIDKKGGCDLTVLHLREYPVVEHLRSHGQLNIGHIEEFLLS